MNILANWRPRPVVIIVALAGIAVCTRLSIWQWDRGNAKAEIERGRLEAGIGDARTTGSLDLAHLPFGERLHVQGRWRADQTILLDNQTRQGRPGVHVWTLFELTSGQRLLINRGWTALSLDREVAFVPQTPVSERVTGLLRDLPRAGLQTENACTPGALARMNYPTYTEIECTLGEPVLPALLLLDADVPGAYLREWQRFEIPPARHYGYAFQWAALALTLVFLFFRFNRVPPKDDH